MAKQPKKRPQRKKTLPIQPKENASKARAASSRKKSASSKSPQQLLTRAEQKWVVVSSMRDDLDRDGWENNIYDILGDVKEALDIQPQFPAALAFKAELVGLHLGAWREGLAFIEEALAQEIGNAEYKSLRDRIAQRGAGRR